MNKILSLGDHFMFSLEELKKINQNKQENDRIDHYSIEQAIYFFEKTGATFFNVNVILDEDNISFSQSFLDENKNKIPTNAIFGDDFLLHIYEVCPMVENNKTPTKLSLETPISINGVNFYDGDLYCIPLSSLDDYDQSLFIDDFNLAISQAKEKELTHIIFSIGFPDGKRKSADDDFIEFFRKGMSNIDYSCFNFSQSPFVRMFFTNKFGECHISLDDLFDGVNKVESKDHFSSHAFYSETPNKDYFNEALDSITTMTVRSLYKLFQIECVKKSIELIGNFRSDEYNYISTYKARSLFKQHQINKMTHLNDIKAIFISKSDLSESERLNLSPETTHLVFLPVDHKEHPEFKQIFSVEAVGSSGQYQYNETKKEISVSEFNKIIKQAKHFQIIEKSEDEAKNNPCAPLFFPFGVERKLESKISEIAYGIEFGSAYLLPLSSIKKSMNKNSPTYKEIEHIDSLNVKNCIVNVSFPYHFLASDEKLMLNDHVYFERERHLEMRVYPLKGDSFEFLDVIKESDQAIHDKKESNDKKPIPANNIKLNTGDSLNILKHQHSEMDLIEDRKNPFFKRSSVLTERMLKMYADMLLKKYELPKKTRALKF